MVEKRSDKELLGFLWKYVKNHMKDFYLVSFLLLLNVTFGIIAPLFFRYSLSLIEKSENMITSFKIILPPLIAYFLLMIIKWFWVVFQNIFKARLNAQITTDLRVNAFNHILENNMTFFDNSESGYLTSSLTNDIDEMKETGQRFVDLFTSSIRLIVTISILLYFSPILTLASVIFLPVFFIIVFSLRKFQRKVAKIWRKNFASVNQRFSETMRSIAISKSFNREKENINKFTKLNEETYKSSIKRGFAIFIIGPINDFFRHILLIVILAVGTYEISKGNGKLDVSTFYLFIFLMDYYYYPLLSLARNYSRFQSLFVNLERLLNISENNQIREQHISNGLADHLKGEIEFKNVNFSYNKKELQILKNFNLDISPGEKIGLIGDYGWLESEHLVKPAIIGLMLWRWTGYNIIYFLAGIQSIPEELYEAGKIDGANSLQMFYYITVPLLKPIIVFVVTVATISLLQIFTEPYILTGGGPTNSSLSLLQLIYREGFEFFHFDKASALSFILFIIVF